MSKSLLLVVFLVGMAGQAIAGELVEFSVDLKGCTLEQKGGGESVAGTRNQFGCTVKIPGKEFKQKYQFCFLSGVTVYSSTQPGSCQVTYSKSRDTYLFEVSPAREQHILDCSFTCVTQ